MRGRTIRTCIFIEDEDAATLRQAAERLGVYIPKGPGAGQLGNIKRLVALLAAAYRRNPDAVLTLLTDTPASVTNPPSDA